MTVDDSGIDYEECMKRPTYEERKEVVKILMESECYWMNMGDFLGLVDTWLSSLDEEEKELKGDCND